MSSRRYVKRVWRVPRTRGPNKFEQYPVPAWEFFAMLVVKLLVKHGWPAKFEQVQTGVDGFVVVSHDHGEALPPDFLEAVEIAVRIVARTYRVEIEHHENFVCLCCDYEITKGRHFKKVK